MSEPSNLSGPTQAPSGTSAPAARPGLAAHHRAPPVVGFEDGLARRWVARMLGHLPAALPAVALVVVGSPALAIGWYAASRLFYVLYVATVLRRVAARGTNEDLTAREAEWQRFRRHVSWVMDNDVGAFIALNVVTRGSIDLPGPTWAAMALGALLGVVGLWVKGWATASLPPGAYYWRNFFIHVERAHVSLAGPYRWLSDPMYSVGYWPLYGLALFLGSGPGLLASLGAQVLILLLAARVERPLLDHS